MKQFPLKNAPQSVKVDDNVWEWLTKNFSHIIGNLRLHSAGYAFHQKSEKQGDGSFKVLTTYLHKLIATYFLGHTASDEKPLVRMKDGDRLNCQTENLQFENRSTISRFRKTSNATGVRGVYREHNKFRAMISVNGKSVHLGMFDSIDEASQAYEAEFKKHFGELSGK